MEYPRFERRFDPSVELDARLDAPRLFGEVADTSEDVRRAFDAYGDELVRAAPHLRTKDIDDPEWAKFLGKGYALVEEVVGEGGEPAPEGQALRGLHQELRKAFELKPGDRQLRIYPAAGTPLTTLKFAGFVAYGRRIRVPFEYARRGEPEMGIAKVVIPELPDPDTDPGKYQDAIRKSGLALFYEIRRQQLSKKQR